MKIAKNCRRDKDGQWWYYPPSGSRERVYERKCIKCEEVAVVRNKRCDTCHPCSLKGREFSEEHKKKIAEAHTGEKHYNYKGKQNDSGYVLIPMPDHPCATKRGLVPEHRLVMEEIIGRFLKPEEVVHHINGVRNDNRPANLWLFSDNSEHLQFHWELRNSKRKKSNYLYLAGNISEDVRTYEWREEFEYCMREEALWKKVVVVNPCANKFNQSIKGFGEDGKEFVKEAVKRSQNLLRAKDYQLVKMCNIIVVNLALSSVEKPMIGTVQELCWARDILYVPVVAIHENVDNVYTQHSWIDECVSAWVETVEDAAEIIREFFIEY
jgi:hypothetical protein